MDNSTLQSAISQAADIRKNAYAPFSKFKVGAVVVAENGEIFQGVNVENSSFGATVCAERIALFNAVTHGRKDIEAVVIVSVLNGKAVFPCGMCRQVLADFNPEMRVILVNAETLKIEKDVLLSEIFPETFKFSN
ncbi:MAG TPA: cytidine deaminase [bacterium]|jgi:cytidine deaminase|nr:cytidine deaminase [bacterium]HNZ53910.1 cytidine deaminase [bacterium]HOG43217.1 cytidine deaminase [bacterium]HPA56497.1 cytidine deaminase [bacterium]HPG35822.1 cytidine deaminase [bacterium]